MRSTAFALGLMLVAASCGSTPAAPVISSVGELCTDDFCVKAPDGWNGRVEENTIAFSHPLSENATVFVSLVDMAWMVESTGSSWPASLESVERAYWSLLGPQLKPERVLVSPDGWSESRGRFDGLPRWHSFRPIDGGPEAVAMTVLLPDDDWDTHARTFLDGVTLLP